ncbi:hypothetical protein [Stappia indica]|uniref:Transposase n=1 Tax=Stappia indica TaxID=538381 RepID=A0A857C5I6_9HYPH|nr:hypothetical protein [Stappia indica]QGZ34149.1 hypothetical protein GH266_06265 [Stappia indica]
MNQQEDDTPEMRRREMRGSCSSREAFQAQYRRHRADRLETWNKREHLRATLNMDDK